MTELTSVVKSVPLNWYILLCTMLFCIGVMGVLLRRNVIVIFMSIELMLNSVNLLFTAFSSYSSNPAGQIFVFFVMVVAAAEIAIGLAIVIMIHRNNNSVDVNDWSKLKW
jgi:NADH-quinone oxidoreductase subunit K